MHVGWKASLSGRLAGAAVLLVSMGLGLPPRAAADAWVVTGGLQATDLVSAGILLHDDRVLVISGDPAGADDSELYDPATGTWREIGPVGPGTKGRGGYAAVLLQSGQVLVTGGDLEGGGPSKSCRLYDPFSGTWRDAGSLTTPRAGHTATLLDDGRVLVVGGRDDTSEPTATAELYDPATDAWAPTDSPTVRREHHTATYIPGKRTVMVAGGRTSGGATLNSSEVFDVGTETWVAVSFMGSARSDHSATLLPSGRVLVAGGDNTEGAELFDPGTDGWSPTGSLPEARWMHSATLLPSGLVLVAGGQNATATLKTVYAYDYTLGQFVRKADLTVARFGHAATMMPDGRVLVAGGQDTGSLRDAELYDQDAPTWKLDLSMQEARSEHLTVLLRDGRVLALGGVGSKTAETFDPSTGGPWKYTNNDMSAIRYRGTATLLNDGRVLAAGTIASGGVGKTVDLFDPGSDSWIGAASMAGNRYEHSASLLACGEVLVAGGESSSGVVLDTAERYNPQTDTWRPTGKLNKARWAHTATTLLDGRILVTGGWNLGRQASAEIYDPDGETWTYTPGNMSTGRYHHQAVLLPSGKVLIVGGSSPDNTAEIFDPATGFFTALTRPLITGRSDGFTATLLLNGRVLIAGGFSAAGAVEAYDPAAVKDPDKLVAYPPMNLARNQHAAILLKDGRVLATGGSDNRTEMFEIGRGGSSGWAPILTDVTNPLVEGSILTAAGVQFVGLGEASSGLGSQHSATNYPLIQLRHIDSDRVRWLLSDPGASWSATKFRSVPVTGCIPGPTRATVFTNGIPGVSHIIMVECLPPTVTTSPVDAQACVGSSAVFTVAASGKCPAYQWRKNLSALLDGGSFSGTRTPTLTITGVSAGEAGSYDAIASLSCSSTVAFSTAATLTVHGLLSGVTAGLSGSSSVCASCLGGTFSESHGGGGAVTYQWGYRTSSGGTVTAIPGQTGSGYVLNGADLPGPGSYFIVVTTSPTCGLALVSNEVPITVTATTGSSDVPFFTVTSRDQENVLEWVYPGGTLDVRIRYTSGLTCTPPTDPVSSGTLLVDQTGVTPGQKDRYVHSPLTNGTTYCYTVFAGAGPWSPGRANHGRPMDTTGPVKWAFSTGVFSITAPTVGGSAILATSNEPVIHAMERGLGPASGEWPALWKPVPVDGAVQSRLPIVPVTVGGVNPVAYLGTQMGSVFVIDAVQGGAAASPYPWAPFTPTPIIQAAPAGMFTAFGGSFDYLLVGSRVGGVDNQVYAIDALAGGVLDTFDNGGGATAIGPINGMGSVAYGVDRYYFASQDRGGGSLWCLDLSGPPLPLMTKRWSRALGDIDSSPVLSSGTVYVGSPLGGGTLYAVEAVSGLAINDRTFLHADGQVKGFVFPDRPNGDLYLATDGFVWALHDDGSTITNKFAGPIALPGGAVPTSAVLFIPGSHYVYVGANDGKLYEIDVSGAVPVVKGQTLGDGLATVGAPSLDWPNALLHVGTEAGIFYAVAFPFP